MKNLSKILFVAGLSSIVLVSCGPSAEEKAKAEQLTKDSIAAAMQQAMDDSLAIVKATEDSIASVQAMQDSIARAIEDSIATAKPGKPKTKPKPKAEPQPTKPEDVKPGQGRG